MNQQVCHGKTRPLVMLLVAVAAILGDRASAASWQRANPNNAPARYVGKIVAFYRTGTISAGSGVLIGPRHVLTAGHCLMDEQKKWAGRPESEWKPAVIMFTPGLQNGKAPFGSANAERWAISNGFLDGSCKSRDYGVILLNRRLGDITQGWAAYSQWMNGWSYNVTVYGYPAQAEWPQTIGFSAQNYTSWGSVLTDWHLWYSPLACVGIGGASGGPVFDTRMNVVRGVFGGTKVFAGGRRRMYGCRLSDWVCKEITDFIRKYK